MATYTHEAGSQFPSKVFEMNPVKDIDDDVKNTIQQYYLLVLSGKISDALELKKAHPELDDYWVDAAKINYITEEIRNIGIYALMQHGTVVSDEEPNFELAENSFWYREVK